MIGVEKAREILVENTVESKTEYIEITKLNGRVLAEDIFSSIDSPPFPKSPLDGYAVRASDIEGACKDNGRKLKVIDKIYAGDVSQKIVEEGTCIRLMTGSKIPQGADCIVRQEDCVAYENYINVHTSHKPYENYIYQGEDFKKGDKILEKGILLKSSHIMGIASLGINRVLVYKKPVVGVITTGSEIQNPGETLNPGKIYNSNGYFLSSRLIELGVEPIMFNLAEDDELNIIDGINKANEVCDIVVTTGGVSVGEKDLIEACLVKMDYEILFHGVDLKPGSPILAAKKENKILVALSGTPVAAATTFELFVRPMLSKILSCEELNYKVVKGIMQDEFKKASNKRRFLRVKIDQELENKVFIDFITQSPSQIHTMINSNGLLEVPKGTVVNRNDEVNVILL